MSNAPKLHNIVHVPELILKYGPLKRFSTLGFEQKHQFFKQEFNNQNSGFAVLDPKQIDNDERKKTKFHQTFQFSPKMCQKTS